MVLQHKGLCIRRRQRNKRCVKFLKRDEHFKNEAVPSRRYDEVSECERRNEQILVKIRSGATLSHKLYFY